MASHQQLGKGRESVLVEFAWAGGFPSEGRTLPGTKCVEGGGYIQQTGEQLLVRGVGLLKNFDDCILILWGKDIKRTKERGYVVR